MARQKTRPIGAPISRPPTRRRAGGFAERLSPLIAAAGVVPVPALLIRYQARLGLTPQELTYLLHVLSHRWDDSNPWVAVSSVAEATGKDERNVRTWKESLQKKGYLICTRRVIPRIGRGADEHDLSPLFAALEALALEEETRKTLDRVREDLPEARFFHGGVQQTPQLSTTTRLSTARRGKNARYLEGENVRDVAGENAPRRPARMPATQRVNAPGERELRPDQSFQESRLQQSPSAEARARLTGSAPRSHVRETPPATTSYEQEVRERLRRTLTAEELALLERLERERASEPPGQPAPRAPLRARRAG